MGMSTISIEDILVQRFLSDRFARKAVGDDFSRSLQHMGMGQREARVLAQRILFELNQPSIPLKQREMTIYELLSRTPVSVGDQRPVTVAIDDCLRHRAKHIFGQVHPHLQDVKGEVLDFGAGDMQVTQMLADSGLNVTGVDVRAYAVPHISVPFELYDGQTLPFPDRNFAAAVATNVLHHAADNARCLQELTRVTADRLVIIETIPVGCPQDSSKPDMIRGFMNDYFYNRLLHDPRFDVPVPGTFETPENWIRRIEGHGWRCVHSENLGIDLPVIQDIHHLLVFERA